MPTKKELRLYGDLVYQHKPTIRTIVWQAMIEYFAKKNRYRKPPYINEVPLEEVISEQKGDLPMVSYFAVIRKGIVEEIIVVNYFIASLLKQRGVKFLEFNPEKERVERGMKLVDNQLVSNDAETDKEEVVNEEN